jgi:hypothetical protein
MPPIDPSSFFWQERGPGINHHPPKRPKCSTGRSGRWTVNGTPSPAQESLSEPGSAGDHITCFHPTRPSLPSPYLHQYTQHPSKIARPPTWAGLTIFFVSRSTSEAVFCNLSFSTRNHHTEGINGRATIHDGNDRCLVLGRTLLHPPNGSSHIQHDPPFFAPLPFESTFFPRSLLSHQPCNTPQAQSTHCIACTPNCAAGRRPPPLARSTTAVRFAPIPSPHTPPCITPPRSFSPEPSRAILAPPMQYRPPAIDR